MRFPNAYEGVKKIFTAEILEIISVVTMAGAGIAAVVLLAALNADSAGAAIGTGAAMIVLGLGTAVLAVISMILTLVGLKRAGIDEESFKQGMVLAIIVLVLSAVYGIINSIAGTTIFDDLVMAFVEILKVGVTLYIVKGINILADKLGNDSMAEKGRKLFMLYAIILVVSAVLRFIGSVVGNNAVVATGAAIIAIIAAIGSIVAYIIFLVYLAQAKKMLAEN